MSRTKYAIFALFVARQDTFGPLWLQAILSILSMVAMGYLLWFIWSDTEPRETYTQRVAGKPIRVER